MIFRILFEHSSFYPFFVRLFNEVAHYKILYVSKDPPHITITINFIRPGSPFYLCIMNLTSPSVSFPRINWTPSSLRLKSFSPFCSLNDWSCECLRNSELKTDLVEQFCSHPVQRQYVWKWPQTSISWRGAYCISRPTTKVSNVRHQNKLWCDVHFYQK